MAEVDTNLLLFQEEWAGLTPVDGNAAQSTASCWLSDYDDEDFIEDEEDGAISDAASVPTIEDLLATADGCMSDADDSDSDYTPSEAAGVAFFLRCLQESNSEDESEDSSMPDLQSVSDSDSECDSTPDLQSVSDSMDWEEEQDLGESDAESLPSFFSAYEADCNCDEKISHTASPDGPVISMENDQT
ncbi:hypothetical protein DFH07DRAFT_781778 [Mycena maculata]|uniref:Uncharacterized protein n=1 Tax=Mycena maculata TaxID=230809 RepID=A0AAD7MSH9_9AGAR|nr:hypothetical protein DFH07DRAFT_781778 [Mycena maculata]